jgi:RimJ/RimL family protein N-acetyltransferase
VDLHDDGITLRAWRDDDAAAVTAACQDPEISRWIPFVPQPYTEEDAHTFVRNAIEETARGHRHAFAILDRETDAVVGSMDMRVNAMGTGHIGYWIARDVRGRGLCTRALRLISEWALDELGLGRLELMTDPENIPSQRVAEKVGFRREAVLRAALQYRDGSRNDSVMFSLLPGELV